MTINLKHKVIRQIFESQGGRSPTGDSNICGDLLYPMTLIENQVTFFKKYDILSVYTERRMKRKWLN